MINKYKYYVYYIVISLSSLLFAQSIQELNRLKNEYQQVKKTDFQSQTMNNNSESSQNNLSTPGYTTFYSYQKDLIQKDIDNKHFGYNFFTLRDSIPFWENLPTPSNYLLGPGDELIISLWGETQIRSTYVISREGKIYDPKVGLLNMSGNTILSAEKYLKSQFGRVYATLNGKTPSTFIDISLGKLKSINVNFVGQVKYPGVYPIHPFSNLIIGLIQAGGIDTTGSLREIQIKRHGSIINSVDLYDYFLNGELSSNIQLRDQDVVVVPPRISVVSIDSAVIRPGIYESSFNETIYDMIQYAGGLSHNASDNIGIYRFKRNHKNEKINSTIYEGFYVDYSSTKIIPSNNGDKIIVQPLFNEDHFVEIIGQVKAPGEYFFSKGMTFKKLLSLAGGLEDSTFLKSVYIDEAKIIRRNPGSRYDEVVTIKLSDIINNENKSSVLLQNLDRVVIHSNSNFFGKENIMITGEVSIPGTYPLISDGESLESIIVRSGGLTSTALENGIAIYRLKKYFEVDYLLDSKLLSNDKNNKNETKVRVAWENKNIALMPGDSVVVKETTSAIFVDGEVYNPGVLEYRQGKPLKYYINAVGGLTSNANKNGIIVLYANGMVSPKKWYANPKILDGSTIIVNKKPPSEPFDMTQFATNWTSIISSVITAVILTKQL